MSWKSDVLWKHKDVVLPSSYLIWNPSLVFDIALLVWATGFVPELEKYQPFFSQQSKQKQKFLLLKAKAAKQHLELNLIILIFIDSQINYLYLLDKTIHSCWAG